MNAKILTVANQKGGAGKTTVTMNLAGSMAARGYRVLVVDADPQGTAVQYAAQAEEGSFPARVVGLAAAGAKVHNELRKHIADNDIIIVDTPPSIDAVQPSSAMLVSDLIIVPVPPSPPDLWAVLPVRQKIEQISVTNETVVVRLLLNKFNSRRALAGPAMAALEEIGIPVLNRRLSALTAYQNAAARGVWVGELKAEAGDSRREVALLTDELLELMGLPAKNRAGEGESHGG